MIVEFTREQLEQVNVGLILRSDDLIAIINDIQALPSTSPVHTEAYEADLTAAKEALKVVADALASAGGSW